MPISQFLRQQCFPCLQGIDGNAMLAAFNAAASASKWLPDARNRDAMHFATFEQSEPGLTVLARNRIGFEYVRGTAAGESLFLSSNTMASVSFFHRGNGDDWVDGLKTITDDLAHIHGLLSDLIHVALEGFVLKYDKSDVPYRRRVRVKAVGKFPRSGFNEFDLPYFFALGDVA